MPDEVATLQSQRPHGHRIDADGAAGGHLIPDTSPPVMRKWSKGTGGPSGDEAQNLIAVPDEAATLSGGGHPNSAAPGRRKEDDTNLIGWTKQHAAEDSEDAESWAEAEQARTLLGGQLALHSGAAGALVSAYNVTPESGQGADLKVVETDESAALTRTDSEQTDRGTRIVAGTGDSAPMIAGAAAGVRRLTPTECERLQGFPDGWTEIDGPGVFEASSSPGRPWKRTAGTPDGRRYQALGDAVTVNAAEWLARRLRSEIG